LSCALLVVPHALLDTPAPRRLLKLRLPIVVDTGDSFQTGTSLRNGRTVEQALATSLASNFPTLRANAPRLPACAPFPLRAARKNVPLANRRRGPAISKRRPKAQKFGSS